jgi:hypothetical protein
MASKRNQFDAGNSGGGVRINGKRVGRTDRSNGETRGRMNRQPPDRSSGKLPKQ